MPPKRAAAKSKAKAKAQAMIETKNARRNQRQAACRSLNDLALEVSSGVAVLDVRVATGPDVQAMVRHLERRSLTDDQLARLRAAAALFRDNGGSFQVPLVDDEGLAGVPVPKHRVLQPSFELKSKAFMLTYNGLAITTQTWTAFKDFH